MQRHGTECKNRFYYHFHRISGATHARARSRVSRTLYHLPRQRHQPPAGNTLHRLRGRVDATYHFHHGMRRSATSYQPGKVRIIPLIICASGEAQQCGYNIVPAAPILSFTLGSATPWRPGPSFSLPFSSPFLTFNCSTEWFFCGGFFKAKKVFLFFSGAPALSCAPAPRHSPALAESPRRGSAGPWAPWRPFSDQKVGRRRSGARLFAFLSNCISVFGRHGLPFPSRHGPLNATMEVPRRGSAGLCAPAPTPSSPALSHTPGRPRFAPPHFNATFHRQKPAPKDRSKKSCACASGARLFCRLGEGALL